MLSLTRARKHTFSSPAPSAGQLLLIAALLVVLCFAPGVVARSVTSEAEPVDFLRRPWMGWMFAGTVLRESVRADVAAPGEALTVARRRWSGAADSAEATRVELLYVPDGSFTIARPGPDRSVALDESLVWRVLGRLPEDSSERMVGLIGFRSGTVIWDHARSESAPDASMAQPETTPADPEKDGQ